MQGNGIPHVIGAYADILGYSIAMELPHESLWTVAHKDISPALRQRCVDAFRRLHAFGILHGQPDLRHLLIGADGRVTIIDFGKCRSMLPFPAVGLEQAGQAELMMELRIIKYKLDYEGAQGKEDAKRVRVRKWLMAERMKHTKDTADMLGLEFEVDQETHLLAGDLSEPPASKDDFATRWQNSSRVLAEAEMEVIVPGTAAEVVQEARSTLASVSFPDLPRQDASRKRKAPDVEPSPASSKRQRTCDGILVPAGLPHVQADPHLVHDDGRNSRKRKLSSTSDDPPISKRPRTSHSSQRLPPSEDVIDLTDSEETEDIQVVPGHPYRTTTFAVNVTSDLPVASSSLGSSHTPSVRDFAYEAHPAQSCYAPHPPTEGRMQVERAIYIRHKNCMAALALQPPDAAVTYHFDEPRLTFAISGKKRRDRLWSLGALKRSWDPALAPDPLQGHYKHALGDDLPGQPPRAFTHVDGEFFESNETLQLTRKTREPSESRQSHTASPSSGSAPPLRSILRPTPTVRTVSYRRKRWPAAAFDPETHDKSGDGPQAIPLDIRTKIAVLNGDFRVIPHEIYGVPPRVYEDEDEDSDEDDGDTD